MCKKLFVVGVLALVLIFQLVLVAPVAGITNPIKDDTIPPKYPFVGYLGLDRHIGTGIGTKCMGTLIADHVFLTDEQCIWPVLGEDPFEGYVTFDNPVERGYPQDTGINWIQFQASDIRFIWMYGMEDPSHRPDIVVILLPEDVDIDVTPFSRLPEAGLLDDLSAHGGLHDVEFTSVGSGMQMLSNQGKPQWDFTDWGWRSYASAPFQALTQEWFFLNINEQVTDGGGACWFDAGGPVFLNDGGEDVLVGVATRGNTNCRATVGYYRLDTPWAQVLLSQFVELP